MRSRLIKKIVLELFLSLMLGSVFSSHAFALTTREVTKGLICNCGCKQILADCSTTMPECSVGQSLKGVIDKKIEGGWPKGKIINYMVKNYEEQILAAPTKKGFNLVGWTVPFVAVLVSGVLIYLVIVRWVRETQELKVSKEEKTKIKEPEDKYTKRLKEELKKFEY